MWRWLVAILLLIVTVATPFWFAASQMVAATPSWVAPAKPPASDLKIASSDGVVLAATYRRGRSPDAPAVLLLHGNGASRAQVDWLGEWLAGLGYASLAIDFRGHGQSTERLHSFGLFESEDAAAALNWLRQKQHGGRIAVLGISLGGASALLGDRGPLAADAMILQAVYPDIRRAIRNRAASLAGAWGGAVVEPLLSLQSLPRYGVWPGSLSPVAAIRNFHGPVMIVGGALDRFTLPAETRELFDAAPGPRRLWWARDSDHAAVSGENSPVYRAQLRAFLRDSLGDPAHS